MSPWSLRHRPAGPSDSRVRSSAHPCGDNTHTRWARTNCPAGGVLVSAMAVHSRSRAPGPAYPAHATSKEIASTGVPRARPPERQLQPLELLLIAGLAGVFV